MTSRTSPGLAAMSMLDSVRSAMRGRLHRVALQRVLQTVHRPLPPAGVPGGHVTRRPRPPRAPQVVVHDHAVPPRLDPHLHVTDDLPRDRPAHPLGATVALHRPHEVGPDAVAPRVVVEPPAHRLRAGPDVRVVDDVDAALTHATSVPHVTPPARTDLPAGPYPWVVWPPRATVPRRQDRKSVV